MLKSTPALLLSLILGAMPALAAGGGGGSSSDDCAGAPTRGADDYCRAVDKVNDEEFSAAESLLQSVLRQNPSHANTLNYLGYVTRKQGRFAEALDFYQKALALEPRHLGANEYLGELYLQMKDLPKAEERLMVLQAACGACEEYEDLAAQIEAFKKQ